MVDDLTKWMNAEAKRFRRSLPPRLRPGTLAYMRADIVAWKRLLRGGKFPVGVTGSGIRGIRRK